MGEVCQVLGETDGLQFCSRFDITAGGNFEGKSIPNLIGADDYVRQERKDVRERLSACMGTSRHSGKSFGGCRRGDKGKALDA